MLFFDSRLTLTCYFGVHRAGSQLKTIAIFAYKQRLLSIEMKTKLVQHVESDWMRDWKSGRVRKSESERVCEWLLSIDMKTKVVQHVEREWMSASVWKSVRVREFQFPAFVWHSDIFRLWPYHTVSYRIVYGRILYGFLAVSYGAVYGRILGRIRYGTARP